MRIKILSTLLVAAAVGLACGGGGGSSDGGAGGGGGGGFSPAGGGSGGGLGGGAGGGGGSTAATCCKVFEHNQYVAADGTLTDAPGSLADYTWTLLTAFGDAGYSSVGGTVANNEVTFPQQPSGEHVFAQRSSSGYTAFFVTSSNSIDLSYQIVGRPGMQPASAGTVLSLNVQGLSPWSSAYYDSVAAVASPSLAVAQSYASHGLDTPPNDADTSHLFHYAWEGPDDSSGAPLPVLNAAAGDKLYVLQSRFGDLDAGNGDSWSHVLAGAEIATFNMVDGADSGTSVTLSPAPMVTPTLDWKRDQFRSAIAFTTSNSVVSYDYAALYPAYTQQKYWYLTPTLAVSDFLNINTPETVRLSAVNPFPSTWPLVFTNYTRIRNDFGLPDGGAGRVSAYVEATAAATANGSTTLAPIIGTVSDVRINGQPATSTLANVGETPLVTWTAPTLGTPTSYNVLVVEPSAVDDGNGGTFPSFHSVLRIYTSKTQARIPPGMLKPNTTYAIKVSAQSVPGVTTESPYEDGFPFGSADAVTAAFTR